MVCVGGDGAQQYGLTAVGGGLGKGQLCHTASQEPYIPFLILPRKQGLYEPLFAQVPGLLDQGFFSLYFDLDFCFGFLK